MHHHTLITTIARNVNGKCITKWRLTLELYWVSHKRNCLKCKILHLSATIFGASSRHHTTYQNTFVIAYIHPFGTYIGGRSLGLASQLDLADAQRKSKDLCFKKDTISLFLSFLVKILFKVVNISIDHPLFDSVTYFQRLKRADGC